MLACKQQEVKELSSLRIAKAELLPWCGAALHEERTHKSKLCLRHYAEGIHATQLRQKT